MLLVLLEKHINTQNRPLCYGFTYDAFGNTTSVKVGSVTLAAYTYAANNGLLQTQTYGNGDTVSYTYDNLGRAKAVTYADGRVVTYRYNGEGQLYSTTETGGSAPATYLYTYDSLGRLISGEMKNSSGTLLRTSQGYDANNRLLSQGWQMGSTAYSESYTYNEADGSLNTMTTGDGSTLTMGYDALRRLASIDAGIYTAAYTYRDLSDTATTLQVAGLQYTGLADALSFGYTYDEVGNLATYTENGTTQTYTYDDQGQLLTATDGTTTYTYTYDTVGNIITASNGTVTHTYGYTDDQWQDLLTAFDGQTIAYQGQTYDADTNTVTGTAVSGNPVSYYNGTRWSFGWANGRRLVTATDGDADLSYTYNADGLRMTKTVDGVAHTYLYAGGKLLREIYGDTTLDFFYDANGNPFALKHNGTVYYYITNLQGDVLFLVDADGNTVAAYTYDPYGKVLTATGTLANINPLRYRGYYFDTETGFYYLQSRYYDPAVCRFINADGYASTGQGILGHNMFAYCGNSPISLGDPNGDIAVATLILIGSAIIGAVCAGYTAYKEYQAGCETSQIVVDSICAGYSGFCIVYTGGMSAYQCYQNYCYLNAITPVTNISNPANVANQIQSCANTANSAVEGNGPIVGTQKHAVFAAEVNSLGNSRLVTEVSYKNGEIVAYGTRDSIRFDVLQYNQAGVPIAAWDLKTGSASLSQLRVDQMQAKSGLDIPIYCVK